MNRPGAVSRLARMSAHRESCRTRGLLRAFLGLVVVLACSLTTSCASNKERWAEISMQELSYQNLFASVLDMLELEGYLVHMQLPDTGEIDTDWLRGISRREVRGPSRRKAHIEIKPLEGPRQFVVRIRVEEEIIRKGGMLARENAKESEWEPFPDNFEDAEYLAAKLRALLADYAIKVQIEVESPEYYQ